MSHKFYFEKLDVWQNAREFVKEIYLTTSEFPNKEKFGITSQLQRSSVSISANIAEGMSRSGTKDKLRFLNFAYSSAIEVLNYLILCLDLSYLDKESYKKLRAKLEYITNQISALSKTIKRKV